MKAIVHTKYGPPGVAMLKEIAKPVPKDNEVLVKVFASTVNRTDAGFRSAEYFISRFWSGLLRPKCQTLGSEFAGMVEATGKDVTAFKSGDRIFGYDDQHFGGHAEYLTIAENKALTTLPANMNYYDAAPMSEGAHYALVNIRASNIQKGQNALVYGATGAIGSAAVQLLKHFGIHVTAVCNTKNVALVKSLGADIVIDYQAEDFTNTAIKFHFIFDAVGKSSFGQCKPLLTEKGIYVSTEFGKNAENLFYALTTAFSSGKKLLFPMPTIHKEDLEFLKQLAENGEYKPVVERQYTLEEIVAAYEYVESGQKTGNVVIRVVDQEISAGNENL